MEGAGSFAMEPIWRQVGKCFPKGVWKLGWISFFADVASEMAYPILPLFLRSLGAPVAAMGLIEGLADSTASVLKGISGVRSDRRMQRLPYVRWGYGLSALGKPLIALAYVWPMVAVARVLDRYGKGIRTTARDAMLADAAPKDRLGAVFGLHRAMDTAGALVGVLISLGLMQSLPGQYRTIFLLAVLPGVVSVVLAFGLWERARPVETTTEVRVSLAKPGLAFSNSLKRTILLHAVFAIANTSDTFLLLRAKEHFHLSDSLVIAAYLFYNIAYAALSYPAGHLSDRVGRWPVIALGWLCYAGVYLGFAFASNGWIWPLFLVYGIYVALSQGTAKAQVAELAPKDSKATVLGRFYMVSGICSLIGNVAFGLVWDHFGAQSALTGAAILTILVVLLIPLMRPSSDVAGSVSGL